MITSLDQYGIKVFQKKEERKNLYGALEIIVILTIYIYVNFKEVESVVTINFIIFQ